MNKLWIILIPLLLTGCASLNEVGIVHWKEQGTLVVKDRSAVPADFTVTPEQIVADYLDECIYTYYCQIFADKRYYYLVADYGLANFFSKKRSASVVVDGVTGERKR